MTQISPGTLASVFTEMVNNNPDSAVRLVSGLQRKLQSDFRGEPQLRADNLKAQLFIANLLGDNVDLKVQPWNQLAQMMAEFWMTEAENTFTAKTGPLAAARNSSRPKNCSPPRPPASGSPRCPPASASTST